MQQRIPVAATMNKKTEGKKTTFSNKIEVFDSRRKK